MLDFVKLEKKDKDGKVLGTLDGVIVTPMGPTNGALKKWAAAQKPGNQKVVPIHARAQRDQLVQALITPRAVEPRGDDPQADD